MTSNDRKALKIVLAEPQRNTEHSFNFLKFSVFIELERKNDFSGNLAIFKVLVAQQPLLVEPFSDSSPAK